MLLATAYEAIDTGKAIRLKECGKCLTYRVYEDGTKILDSMESCRVRLCPICTWRRSLKVYAQTAEIVETISHDMRLDYILLTLTVRNCEGAALSETIDNMMHGWDKLMQRKQVKGAAKGWYRSLEITHDVYPFITKEMFHGDRDKHIKSRAEFYKKQGLKVGDPNPNYNMFHPHFHVLIAVNPSYFTSRNYISHEEWLKLWKQAIKADYAPQVDVRRVKGNSFADINKAVCEVAKYACKDTDYIVPDDWDLTVETVRTLDSALARRRLVAYGGYLKDYKALLKLDDEENGDLVHIGDDEGDKDKEENFRLVSFFWYAGYRQYYTVK